MFKKFLGLSILFLSSLSYASTGFVTHKIINKTKYDFDFIVRQIFTPALFGCADRIAANTEKTCMGEYDSNNGLFVIDYFKNTYPKIDYRTTIQSTIIRKGQALTAIWTIVELPNKDFDVKIKLSN